MPEPEPLAYGPVEAARMLGISRTRLYGLMDCGTIPSFKLGRRRLIRRDALLQALETLEAAESDPRAQVVEAAAELVARTTKDQGLPRTVSDAGALQRIAAILRATPSLHAAGGDAA